MTEAMSARTRSSAPAARAASRLSIAAAARPFMKTLRSSFRPGGVSRARADDVDRHPEGAE